MLNSIYRCEFCIYGMQSLSAVAISLQQICIMRKDVQKYLTYNSYEAVINTCTLPLKFKYFLSIHMNGRSALLSDNALGNTI